MQPRIVSLLIVVSLFFSTSLSQLFAQEDPVVVNKVDFKSKVSPYDDYLMEVELEAKLSTPESIDPKYLDDVKVEVLIGYPHPVKKGEFIFHRSEVDIATMELRQSRKIGFWLPYDVAQRDQMSKEPEYWLITLSVGGTEIPLNKSNAGSRTSRTLTNKQAIDSMLGLATDATEGVFLPGYLSGNGYRESGRKRPAFIRIEEQK